MNNRDQPCHYMNQVNNIFIQVGTTYHQRIIGKIMIRATLFLHTPTKESLKTSTIVSTKINFALTNLNFSSLFLICYQNGVKAFSNNLKTT